MFYRLIRNAAPLPISRLFANRARILLHRKPLPVNRFRSRQPTITPADAANSRSHPKVAKSLTFIPARVRKWQSYTVFGIVSQRSEARQAVCSVTLSCFSLRGRRYRMGESAHCRNRFASLEQRRLLERGILLRHGRLHRARGQRHVAAIRQPMPAVREIGPRRTQPPHSLLRAQHQRHAIMNR